MSLSLQGVYLSACHGLSIYGTTSNLYGLIFAQSVFCHSLLLCAVFFPFVRCTQGPITPDRGTALLQVPTLQKPLLLQGFLAHLLRCQLLLSLLAPQVRPVLSCIWAAKRVKLCPFLPAHAIRIRLVMPKPFVVCAEVSVA